MIFLRIYELCIRELFFKYQISSRLDRITDLITYYIASTILASTTYPKMYSNKAKQKLTVGGDKFIVEPLLSWGPILECLLMGRPPPGVPPGDEAQEGAIRIFGVIRVLSDSLRFGNAFTTLRRLLSGDEGEPPNHQPPNIPP